MLNEFQFFLHCLNSFPGFGPVRLSFLLKHFKSPRKAFEAKPKELLASGLEENLITKFITFRQAVNLDLETQKLEQEKIGIITKHDSDYPFLLKQIAKPPIILYYKGDRNLSRKINLGIVGSRKCSLYGKQVLETILPPIFKNYQEQINIISGLALGIDALAHSVAIQYQENTVGVLGCGLDEKTIFPKENKNLAKKILETNGSLISEFPPETPPQRHHFPQRNRIISGLSQSLLVVEAELRSGALITANFSLEQGRDVLAIPGNIFSASSQGTNKLIRAGAEPINKSEDLAQALNLSLKKNI